MRLRFAFLVISLLMGNCVTAQTVEVRSGEHDGFTRLVLNLPERMKWEVERHDGGASILFEGPELQFDTRAAFQRISRDRLTGLNGKPGVAQLDLEFECPCDLRGFWHERSMLVIDLFEIKEPKEMPQAETLPPAEKPAERPDAGLFPLGAPDPVLRPSTEGFITGENAADAHGRPAARSSSEPGLSGKDMPELEPLRAELLEELGRAVNKGLLDPARQPPDRDKTTQGLEGPGTSPDPKIEETAHPDLPPVIGPRLRSHFNVTAQNSIDRERDLQGSAKVTRPDGLSCSIGPRVEISTWGNEATPYNVQVGRLHGKLMGEFDEPAPEIVHELARLMVYFGFGLEAEQILTMTDETSLESVLIAETALIVEQGHGSGESVFQNMLDCDDASALWAALSFDVLPRDRTINHDAIRLGFAALPAHLRRLFGPVLAKRLTKAGHVDTARHILRMVDRTEGQPSPEAALAEAEIALVAGEPGVAQDKLENAIARNTETSAEALLHLVEQKLSTDQVVSYEMAQLLGAYVQEARNSPLENRLIRAYLPALAASGAFTEAFSLYDRIVRPLSQDDQNTVRDTLVHQLAEKADDVDFLRHILAGRSGELQNLTDQTAALVARRLIRNGFPEEARAFVSGPLPGTVGHAARLLRAEIELALRNPKQAKVELLGLSGPDADAFRAEAHALSGEYGVAVDRYMSSGQTEKALNAAWLAEDWKTLRGSGDDLLGEAADLFEAPEGSTDETEHTPLAKNRQILEESIRSRTILSALLDAKRLLPDAAK